MISIRIFSDGCKQSKNKQKTTTKKRKTNEQKPLHSFSLSILNKT